MGDSIQQWNAIRAANATEELVAHARAEELRRQGVLAPTDGVAEARAHDERVRAANQSGASVLFSVLALFAGVGLFVWICIAVIATVAG